MKVSIFDLDNTLVNTEALRKYRDNRDWKYVYSNIDLTIVDQNTYDILNESKNGKIVVVTSSPSSYASKVLNFHKISYDKLIGYHDVSRRKPDPEGYLLAIEPYLNEVTEIFIYGDEEKDFIAARCFKRKIKEFR